jgi:hypothetical protein
VDTDESPTLQSIRVLLQGGEELIRPLFGLSIAL